MKEDIIEVEVTEDGILKLTTPKISAANHATADEMLKFIARLAGGETVVKPRTKTGHVHSHEHVKGKA